LNVQDNPFEPDTGISGSTNDDDDVFIPFDTTDPKYLKPLGRKVGRRIGCFARSRFCLGRFGSPLS